MTTTISDKNKYWISRHRYYELLHFCRQYYDYKKERERLYETYIKPSILSVNGDTNQNIDKVDDYTTKLATIDNKIDMVISICSKADPELRNYIFMSVVNGLSYETLKMRYNIPCSRSTFYDRYRKFFWLLDKERN